MCDDPIIASGLIRPSALAFMHMFCRLGNSFIVAQHSDVLRWKHLKSIVIFRTKRWRYSMGFLYQWHDEAAYCPVDKQMSAAVIIDIVESDIKSFQVSSI